MVFMKYLFLLFCVLEPVSVKLKHNCKSYQVISGGDQFPVFWMQMQKGFSSNKSFSPNPLHAIGHPIPSNHQDYHISIVLMKRFYKYCWKAVITSFFKQQAVGNISLYFIVTVIITVMIIIIILRITLDIGQTNHGKTKLLYPLLVEIS